MFRLLWVLEFISKPAHIFEGLTQCFVLVYDCSHINYIGTCFTKISLTSRSFIGLASRVSISRTVWGLQGHVKCAHLRKLSSTHNLGEVHHIYITFSTIRGKIMATQVRLDARNSQCTRWVHGHLLVKLALAQVWAWFAIPTQGMCSSPIKYFLLLHCSFIALSVKTWQAALAWTEIIFNM